MHTYIYIIYIIDQVFINIKFLEKKGYDNDNTMRDFFETN